LLRLAAGEFITHRFAIDEITDAMEAVRQRKVIKALLSFQ
jgi:Zn-dependent alcohol dehydrogenase